MKLSEYCSKNETAWKEVEQLNVKGLIEYLNRYIEMDLYQKANSKDESNI